MPAQVDGAQWASVGVNGRSVGASGCQWVPAGASQVGAAEHCSIESTCAPPDRQCMATDVPEPPKGQRYVGWLAILGVKFGGALNLEQYY